MCLEKERKQHVQRPGGSSLSATVQGFWRGQCGWSGMNIGEMRSESGWSSYSRHWFYLNSGKSELWEVRNKASILPNSIWTCINQMKPQLLVCFRKKPEPAVTCNNTGELWQWAGVPVSFPDALVAISVLPGGSEARVPVSENPSPENGPVLHHLLNPPGTENPEGVTRNIQISVLRETMRSRLPFILPLFCLLFKHIWFQRKLKPRVSDESQTRKPSGGFCTIHLTFQPFRVQSFFPFPFLTFCFSFFFPVF